MSGQVDPLNNPRAWDVVVVGGVESPGLARVGDFKRAHEWDVKKGKGSLGATITFVQRPPAKGEITFLLWTAQHFKDWDSFRQLLKYDPTKKTVQAIDIYHPSLADLDVTSVVTESIGNLIHEGEQLYSIKVELLEYFPPPKASAVATPSGSAATPPGGTGTGTQTDPAGDAYQKQIAQLLQQAQAP